MLDGIAASDPPELAAADAPWQDAELTSDLWDSSSLSLGEVAAFDDAVSLEPSAPELSADLFAELPADADSVDIEALGFDRSGDDSIATDDLGLELTPTTESTDDLLNFDQLTSTEEAIAEQPFDLNDLLGDSDAPALEPEATGSLDEVIFLPNAGAIDAPLLEDASLDALFVDDSDAAIAADAVLADLLTPAETAGSEASDFDFLREEPASIELDLSLEPAEPTESSDFDLLDSEDSSSIDADLFDLMQADSAADESNLRFEQSDSIEADLFNLTADSAQSEPFDLPQSAESALDADFLNQIAADDSSDEFDLLEQPESDLTATDLSNLTSADRAESEESNDLVLLEPPEVELEDDFFNLAAADSAESIATDDLFGLSAESTESNAIATDDIDDRFDLTAEASDAIATDDLFGLAAEDSETPLFNLNESDLSADVPIDRELLDAIETDRSLEDALLALDLDVADASDQAEQSLTDLPPVEAIDPVMPLQADQMADSELEFDLNMLESENAAVSAEELSPEELFDLPPADEAIVFDLGAIESSVEEIEPFDLDAALMEEAIAPSNEQTTDALASDNLDDLFALEEAAPTESIDADALDLLLSAEAETPDLTLADQDAALADLDALLMSEAIETPEPTAEEIAIAPDDFDAAFDLDLAPPSAEINDLDDLLTAQPGEAEFDMLLADDSIAEASAEPEDFADLEAMLDSPIDDSASSTDDFADLAALLEPETEPAIISGFSIEQDAISGFAEDTDEEFASLDVLLSDAPAAQTNEFDDLEKLLENADQTLGGSPSERGVRRPSLTPKKRSPGVLKDQNMRVSVKNLDNLNNLVGELVVNRNSLEQTQERVRQFLDNLVYQVQQLSDVGQRMRDLYERSLLESSLLSSRRSYQLSQGGVPAPASHSTGMSFDALEMDRFTGFHTLSQEMIELIVRVRESASDIDRMVDESDQITRMFRQVTTQLQEGLTRSRMVPFDQTAARLPRAVRDISLKCGKQAELVVEGKETLIDKMILEQLYDPMTHLVNNAITHGIETPADRQAAGKPPTGRITIRAFHQGNQTVISVTDDGAGIDPEAVKRKAIEKNLITPAEAREMTRLDVYDLLFLHGFSTRDRADDFAGRGVGMDVVRTSLNEVRGTVNIDSTIGRGTTFTIRLPLTLSISKALCCISNRARIAFPMDGVEDMFDVPREQVQTDSEGRACIQWRDTLLPFQPLADLLRYSRNLGRGSVYGGNQDEDIVSVVVLRSNAGSFLALQVDQVLGEQEIVIKQLEGPVPKPVGVAGATVLGDGHIMPIADVLELIDLSQGRIRREPGSSLWEKADGQSPIEPPATKAEPTVLIVDDSITVRELLSMTFNKVGYRVEQARDGQEAWEKLRSGLPCDLVFCDIEMPRMDGLELLSRIQKDPNLNHLPIAMLTSRGADRHRQMAVQLGAKGYFTKPYLEESLLDAAGRMLKGEVLVN
ncbi:response regulator [Microcoleus sp. FACHB-1515]|nr:response regulator [Microcoleus sp. FACHB-1515]